MSGSRRRVAWHVVVRVEHARESLERNLVKRLMTNPIRMWVPSLSLDTGEAARLKSVSQSVSELRVRVASLSLDTGEGKPPALVRVRVRVRGRLRVIGDR